jgi:hypothetical protein
MNTTAISTDYRQWLSELKTRFRQVQLKAAVAVNTQLLQFYWQLGANIVAQQADERWGNAPEIAKQAATRLFATDDAPSEKTEGDE